MRNIKIKDLPHPVPFEGHRSPWQNFWYNLRTLRVKVVLYRKEN